MKIKSAKSNYNSSKMIVQIFGILMVIAVMMVGICDGAASSQNAAKGKSPKKTVGADKDKEPPSPVRVCSSGKPKPRLPGGASAAAAAIPISSEVSRESKAQEPDNEEKLRVEREEVEALIKRTTWGSTWANTSANTPSRQEEEPKRPDNEEKLRVEREEVEALSKRVTWGSYWREEPKKEIVKARASRGGSRLQ